MVCLKVPLIVALPPTKLYPAIVIPSFEVNDGAYIEIHLRFPVSYDFTKTVPLRDVLVSLFNKRSLKMSPVVSPYTLIFDDIIPCVEGRTICGVPSRIIERKIKP